jgi:hypothetical protein
MFWKPPKLDGIRLLRLPNAGDTGEDSWQRSLRSAAGRLDVPVISLDQAMVEPDLCFVSVEYDRIVRLCSLAEARHGLGDSPGVF